MTRQTVGDESRNGGLNIVGALTAGSISNPTFTGVAQFPDGSASAPSITNTGDTNTGLLFPAADEVAISTNGTERVRVKSDGLVGIGTTSPAHHLEVASANAYEPRLAIKNTNTDASPGYLIFDKSPSDNSLSASDFIANIRFRGLTTGGSSVDIAEIRVQTEGANDATSAPGRLMFYTTPLGSTSTERMRIDSNGLITGTGTSLGAWTAYTPALTAATTNPTLGTGSSATGAYCQIGKTIIWKARIAFGTSGTAAGSGVYRVSLPVNAKETSRLAGTGFLIDSSAGTVQTVSLFINAAGTVEMYTNGGTSFNSVASNSVLWAWDASDSITINGTYEIA